MFESEQGQVSRNDNQRREQDRTRHFGGTPDHAVLGKLDVGTTFTSFENRLHHHDRPVDQYPEVDRPERQQVGGNIRNLHQDKSDQQRQRDRYGHQQRAPPATQEQDQHQHDQQHPFEQRMRHGMQRRIDQVGAVHERMDRNPFGQYIAVQFVDRFVHSLQHLRRSLSAQHLHDPFHAVLIVPRIVRKSQHPLALKVAVFQPADVAQVDRDAVLGLDHDVPEVFEPFDQSDSTDHIAQIAVRNHAASRIDVVLFHLFDHVGERNSVLFEFVRVDLDLVLRRDPAVIADVRHAGHLFQARNDHPFMQVGQLSQIVPVAFDHVTEYLTGRRSQRIQARNGIVGKFHVHQPLLHALPGPIIVHPVLKHEDHGR